jgi:hypothetical protein
MTQTYINIFHRCCIDNFELVVIYINSHASAEHEPPDVSAASSA